MVCASKSGDGTGRQMLGIDWVQRCQRCTSRQRGRQYAGDSLVLGWKLRGRSHSRKCFARISYEELINSRINLHRPGLGNLHVIDVGAKSNVLVKVPFEIGKVAYARSLDGQGE